MVEPTPTTAAAAASPEPELDAPAAGTTARPEGPEKATLLEAELLVEDVSIDGMCGVY